MPAPSSPWWRSSSYHRCPPLSRSRSHPSIPWMPARSWWSTPAPSSWWRGGATNGTVSPRSVVRLVVWVAERLVHPRAAFQFWTADAAAVPVNGWGRPLRIVAGRQTASVMWRPSAVMTSAPLSVSGAVSS